MGYDRLMQRGLADNRMSNERGISLKSDGAHGTTEKWIHEFIAMT